MIWLTAMKYAYLKWQSFFYFLSIFISLLYHCRLLIDFVCLYTYEFRLSLWKIARISVILLLPLLITCQYFYKTWLLIWVTRRMSYYKNASPSWVHPVFVGSVLLISLVVLCCPVCVLMYLVPCCDMRCDFCIKTMVPLYLLLSVWWVMSYSYMCVCLCMMVSNASSLYE